MDRRVSHDENIWNRIKALGFSVKKKQGAKSLKELQIIGEFSLSLSWKYTLTPMCFKLLIGGVASALFLSFIMC